MLTLKPPFRLACAAKMVRRPTESPSSFSKYSVWQRAQEEGRKADSPFLVPFLDYRTQDSEPHHPSGPGAGEDPGGVQRQGAAQRRPHPR
jgi:hypothetical protein